MNIEFNIYKKWNLTLYPQGDREWIVWWEDSIGRITTFLRGYDGKMVVVRRGKYRGHRKVGTSFKDVTTHCFQ